MDDARLRRRHCTIAVRAFQLLLIPSMVLDGVPGRSWLVLGSHNASGIPTRLGLVYVCAWRLYWAIRWISVQSAWFIIIIIHFRGLVSLFLSPFSLVSGGVS